MSRELGDALAELLFRLLGGLEALRRAGRHLDPRNVARLGGEIAGVATELSLALERIEPIDWPEARRDDGERLIEAARITRSALHRFAEHAGDPRALFELYRALRLRTPALELLYPLAPELPPISGFFSELDPDDRDGRRRLLEERAQERGIHHQDNAPSERGGVSLYDPHSDATTEACPLVVSLHGGSGHGRDWLWSWLPTARTHGVVVASPTSIDRTWSLMQPELDLDRLTRLVEAIFETRPIDRDRVLLTGMSDGGTFTFLAGLTAESPFTHLAPVSGVLPPLGTDRARALPGRKIHLVHGALDWMFPVETARHAAEELRHRGADLTYTELEDLSHTYPVEMNARLLDWMHATAGRD